MPASVKPITKTPRERVVEIDAAISAYLADRGWNNTRPWGTFGWRQADWPDDRKNVTMLEAYADQRRIDTANTAANAPRQG